jgi:putative SOS response-associated peptidase YedK
MRNEQECSALAMTERTGSWHEVHDSMPAVLKPEQFDAWLSGEMEVKAVEDDHLQCWPVSKRVNSSKAGAEDATLIEALPPD